MDVTELKFWNAASDPTAKVTPSSPTDPMNALQPIRVSCACSAASPVTPRSTVILVVLCISCRPRYDWSETVLLQAWCERCISHGMGSTPWPDREPAQIHAKSRQRHRWKVSRLDLVGPGLPESVWNSFGLCHDSAWCIRTHEMKRTRTLGTCMRFVSFDYYGLAECFPEP